MTEPIKAGDGETQSGIVEKIAFLLFNRVFAIRARDQRILVIPGVDPTGRSKLLEQQPKLTTRLVGLRPSKPGSDSAVIGIEPPTDSLLNDYYG